MYVSASSRESRSLTKRLFGIHMSPPDTAVVPPKNSSFSTTRVLAPPLAASRAAVSAPPPLPTTTTSKISSHWESEIPDAEFPDTGLSGTGRLHADSKFSQPNEGLRTGKEPRSNDRDVPLSGNDLSPSPAPPGYIKAAPHRDHETDTDARRRPAHDRGRTALGGRAGPGAH